jgi:hypothetical protein
MGEGLSLLRYRGTYLGQCPFTHLNFYAILNPMQIQTILAELAAERRELVEVIVVLERLAQGAQRKNLPTALGLQALQGSKLNRTVSSMKRANVGKRSQLAGSVARSAAGSKRRSGS